MEDIMEYNKHLPKRNEEYKSHLFMSTSSPLKNLGEDNGKNNILKNKNRHTSISLSSKIESSMAVPPCTLACPATVNIEGFITWIKQEKFIAAYELLRTTIPLPGSIGRICDHPCEIECYRRDIDGPVSICQLHRFVADYLYDHPELFQELRKNLEDTGGAIPRMNKRGADRKIAIVGAGPAGITTAYYLAQIGYKPTIFEKEKYCGGMLRYGISDYQLPRSYLQREIELLCEQGIEIRNGQKFGKDFTIKDLKNQGFKSVFLALGAHNPPPLDFEVQQEVINYFFNGIDYLEQLNREMISPDYFKGKKIIVIGGGNIAINSARTARRLGGTVTVIYENSIDMISSSHKEFNQAQEEDITFIFLTKPIRFLKKEKNLYLKCMKTNLEKSDEFGKRKLIMIPNSEFDIICDYVIYAVDRELDTFSMEQNEIILSPTGYIQVDPITLQTSQEGVFAGGEAVTGPASAIEAIAAGHEVAISIDRFLNNEDMKSGREKKKWLKTLPPTDQIVYIKREMPGVLLAHERTTSFKEINQGFTKEQAIREAQRCLHCGK